MRPDYAIHHGRVQVNDHQALGWNITCSKLFWNKHVPEEDGGQDDTISATRTYPTADGCHFNNALYLLTVALEQIYIRYDITNYSLTL
jgi:hypothetical protein